MYRAEERIQNKGLVPSPELIVFIGLRRKNFRINFDGFAKRHSPALDEPTR